MMPLPILSYDLLLCILSHLADRKEILYQCALASWEMNRVASKLLYARVVLYIHKPPHVIDLRDNGLPPEPCAFISALLPRYCEYVRYLQVDGNFSTRPPPRNMLHEVLASAIRAFTNLYSVTFTPWSCHEDLLNEPLRLLSQCPCLREVIVDQSCLDEFKANLLAQLQGLRKLTIENPTRAILQHLIPEWLDRLRQDLVELHLPGNCGSITPGVLKSAIPHLQSIRALTVGLSYSLTDTDIFSALAQLPNLEALCLRYYWQLNSPTRFPALRALRSFTVGYTQAENQKQNGSLCKWIRKVIACSKIEHLSLIDEEIDDENDWAPSWSFDSLIDHLVGKQAGSLKSLDAPTAFIGVEALKSLCRSCKYLEELLIAGGQNFLPTFMTTSSTMDRLHTAVFNIRHIKKSQRRITTDMAMSIVKGLPALRRLTVNGVSWEGYWASTDTGDVEFVLEELDKE